MQDLQHVPSQAYFYFFLFRGIFQKKKTTCHSFFQGVASAIAVLKLSRQQ